MTRPRFTSREVDVLLAALYVYRGREQWDPEINDLFAKLERLQEAAANEPKGGKR